MFARNVSLHLRPNTVNEFTKTMDREIIPFPCCENKKVSWMRLPYRLPGAEKL